MPLTKAQLKEELEDARRKASALADKVTVLEGATAEWEAAGVAEKKLKRELKASSERLENTERELAEAISEMSLAQDRIAELEEAAGAIGESPRGEATNLIKGLEVSLVEAREEAAESQDEADRA